MIVRSLRILAANRDEFLHRATVHAHWHAFEPISATSPASEVFQPKVLAGRDVVAGGTWLGMNRSGRIAVLYVHFLYSLKGCFANI